MQQEMKLYQREKLRKLEYSPETIREIGQNDSFFETARCLIIRILVY